MSAESLPEPRKIGEYTVLSSVAAGSMGEVFHAERPGGLGQVAVKLAHADLVRTPELLAAAVLEIRVALSLVHPNVVRAYASGMHQGRPYIVMEFIDGGTLDDEFFHDRFRNADALLTLMMKVTSALSYAHKHGIIHTDLSPRNILLDSHAEPFVTDFGLARVPGYASLAARVVGGTERYSAELAEKQAPTMAVDVLSIGKVFQPFVQAALPDARDPRLSRSERRRRKRILTNLSAVCARSCSADREQRYQTAVELERDLELLRNGGSVIPIGRLERWRDWALTHRLPATAFGLLLAQALYIPFAAVEIANEQQQRETQSMPAASCRAATYLALGIAQDIARSAAILERLAPRLAGMGSAALRSGESEAEPDMVAEARAAGALNTIFVVDMHGRAQHYWPGPYVKQWQDVLWRDYFKGVRDGRERGPYYADIYRFPNDDQGAWRFAISVPVLGAGGELIGVLVGTKDADSPSEHLPMLMDTSEATFVAILAPQDRASPEGPQPAELALVAGSNSAKGVDKLQSDDGKNVFAKTFPYDCQDSRRAPLFVAEPGAQQPSSRMNLAFAPVGATRLWVAQGTPLAKATLPAERMKWKLLSGLAWAAPLCLGLFGLLTMLYAKRRRQV